MLHLRSCKRYAGRKKIEAQVEDDIHILCKEEVPGGAISRSWRSASGIWLLAAARVYGASRRPNRCATSDACQLELVPLLQLRTISRSHFCDPRTLSDPFSSRADRLDCPHSHSLGTDEQMGLLAVWWPSSSGACHGVPLWQAGLAFAALVYLGGLLHALGWFGPSLWRSSSDLGPTAPPVAWLKQPFRLRTGWFSQVAGAGRN